VLSARAGGLSAAERLQRGFEVPLVRGVEARVGFEEGVQQRPEELKAECGGQQHAATARASTSAARSLAGRAGSVQQAREPSSMGREHVVGQELGQDAPRD